MKTTIFFVVFLTLNLFLSADVIPEDSHEVEKILMIEDTEELRFYPGATVYGYHTGGKVDDAEIYKVKSGTELIKGYKNNDFYLYWALDDTFNLSMLTLDPDSESPLSHPGLKLLSNEINPGNYYIDEDNPLIKEEITYKVYYNYPIVRIYKAKEVKTYNDGTPQKTEEFSPEETDLTAGDHNNTEPPDGNEEQNDTAAELSDDSDHSSGASEVNVGGCSIIIIN